MVERVEKAFKPDPAEQKVRAKSHSRFAQMERGRMKRVVRRAGPQAGGQAVHLCIDGSGWLRVRSRMHLLRLTRFTNRFTKRVERLAP